MTDVVGKLTLNAPAANATEKYAVDYNVAIDGGAIGEYYCFEVGNEQVLLEDCYVVHTQNFASNESASAQIVVYVPGYGTIPLNEAAVSSALTTADVRSLAIRAANDTGSWAGVNTFPLIGRPGYKLGIKVATGAFTSGVAKFVVKIGKAFV